MFCACSVPVPYSYMDCSNFPVPFSGTDVCIIASTYNSSFHHVFSVRKQAVACWDECMCVCV